MRILMGIFILAIYGGITFYLGWNLRTWLLAIQQFRWPIAYWIGLYAISFGYFIGKLHPLLTPFSIVGSYWMFFLQYGLILCVIANLLIAFTPLRRSLLEQGLLVYLLYYLLLVRILHIPRLSEMLQLKSTNLVRICASSWLRISILVFFLEKGI